MPGTVPDTSEVRPFRPIAIGFYLLALPLLVAIFLAEAPSGRWTNGIAAAVMVVCGLLLDRRAR